MSKSIKSEENAKKIVKYGITGLSIYGLNIGITFLCKEIIGFSSELSYFVTMFLIVIYSFFMSLKVIFKVNFKIKILLKYLFYLICFSIINYYCVIYLKNYFGVNYLYLIIILINTILAIVKYFVYNSFVFNKSQ